MFRLTFKAIKSALDLLSLSGHYLLLKRIYNSSPTTFAARQMRFEKTPCSIGNIVSMLRRQFIFDKIIYLRDDTA